VEYFLAACANGEVCVAIVPSRRVSVVSILEVLDRNGIQVRLIGRGSCTVTDAAGCAEQLRGVGLIAAAERDVARLRKIARLCGVAALLVEM
jgi:hypothetical protein